MATNYKGPNGPALLIKDLNIFAQQAKADGLAFILTVNIATPELGINGNPIEFQGEVYTQDLDGLTQRRLMFENMEYIAANENAEMFNDEMKALRESNNNIEKTT